MKSYINIGVIELISRILLYYIYKMNYHKFVIIVPFYNAREYIRPCLSSILNQSYKNFRVVVVDDCSDDGSMEEVLSEIKGEEKFFHIVRNKNRLGSTMNYVKAIKEFSKDPEDIIVHIDGDDQFFNIDSLAKMLHCYQDKEVWATFGASVALSGRFRFYSTIFKGEVSNYRQSNSWNYWHPKTYKRWVFDYMDDRYFRDSRGKYLTVCCDTPFIYQIVELCGHKHIRVIRDIAYIYNDINNFSVENCYLFKQVENFKYIKNLPSLDMIEDKI